MSTDRTKVPLLSYKIDVIQIYTQGENEMVDVKYYKPKNNASKKATLY